jgi:uncharacterized protein
MSHRPRILLVAGWRTARAGSWQHVWDARLGNATHLQLDNSATPVRDVWVAAITAHILAQAGPVVIAAHDLGCVAVAHLPAEVTGRVTGALLVAPADPERRGRLVDFAPVPFHRMPYRNILVASSNDPCCPIRLAGAYARAWGSEFVRLPQAGHIDLESGYGAWPLGMALLQSLLPDYGHAPTLPTPSLREIRSVPTLEIA